MRIDPEVLFCVSDALLCFCVIKFGSPAQMMMDEVRWSMIHQRDFLKVVSGHWCILGSVCSSPYFQLESFSFKYSQTLPRNERRRRCMYSYIHWRMEIWLHYPRATHTHLTHTHTHICALLLFMFIIAQNPTSLHGGFLVFPFKWSLWCSHHYSPLVKGLLFYSEVEKMFLCFCRFPSSSSWNNYKACVLLSLLKWVWSWLNTFSYSLVLYTMLLTNTLNHSYGK